MSIHRCSACYNSILLWVDEEYCYHQQQVLINPYYLHRESYRLLDNINHEFFQKLQNYSIHNIL